MKVWRAAIKTFKEQIRSRWDLILSITLAPLFIIIYWVFMGTGASLTLDIMVVNNDLKNGFPQTGSQSVIQELSLLQHSDGTPVFRIQKGDNPAAAIQRIKDRQSILAVVFPAGYSDEIQRVRENGGVMSSETSATIIGEKGHPYYVMASIFVVSELENYVVQATGQSIPFVFQEQFIGDGTIRKDFDNYVPGLLIAAITMIIFSVSIGIAREIEGGTLHRLVLTRMSSFDLLGGVSLVYIFFSLISVLVSFGVALAVGYHYAGSLALGVLICVLAAMAAIGAGLITACFSRSVGRAAVIANFPLLIMLFFSGAILPLPSPPLFHIGERAIRLFEFLPTSHAVAALNKVLNLGAGAGEIVYELTALIVLTVLLFVAGIWLFRRLQLN